MGSTSLSQDPGASQGRILVIDDDPVIARVVQACMRRHGYEVDCATGSREGIERARQRRPDVILLDIMMPEMSGLEACSRLKACSDLERVPVMFFSAGAKEQFIQKGMEAGASDYIEKPFSETELVARVANLARLARYEQSLRDTAGELRHKNEILSDELETARRMQRALLPPTLDPHPSLRCAALYEPMTEVGGDLYDLRSDQDGTLRILVADVSGHGVFAALLAAFFKMGYQVYSDREPGPGRVLQAIHQEFCRSLDSGEFVTAFAGWLDLRNGWLRYASAGHVPGLLRRGAGGMVERLLPTGPVVGILEESTFGERRVRMSPGDALLLLTDGVLELQKPDGECYGLRRVQTLFESGRIPEPDRFLQTLWSDLRAFGGHACADDDVTALLLEWTAVGGNGGCPAAEPMAARRSDRG